MKFKGPVFPSFLDQQSPRPRMQWKSHCGSKARMRYLRQVCRKTLDSTDPAVVCQLDRVREATKYEPLPEFGLLHLIHAALDACDQTGETWPTCMKYMMDKYDDIQAERTVSVPIPLAEELHA